MSPKLVRNVPGVPSGLLLFERATQRRVTNLIHPRRIKKQRRLEMLTSWCRLVIPSWLSAQVLLLDARTDMQNPKWTTRVAKKTPRNIWSTSKSLRKLWYRQVCARFNDLTVPSCRSLVQILSVLLIPTMARIAGTSL
jgi:hypothetical protein